MERFVELFNNQEYFDAHEHLEEIWIGLEQPDKDWTQGLIQIAALMHLLQQGRLEGALKVWARAEKNLETAPGIYKDIGLTDLKKTIAKLLQNQPTTSFTDVKIGFNNK